MKRARWLALLVVVAGAAGAADDGLRHDPFKRPRFGAAPATADAAPPDGSAGGELPWQPELRGVMQAGAASVANVGGSIVAVGESVDGWQLVRVADGSAVFSRRGKQTTLTMNNAGRLKK